MKLSTKDIANHNLSMDNLGSHVNSSFFDNTIQPSASSPFGKLKFLQALRRKLIYQILLSPSARLEAIHCMANFQRSDSSLNTAINNAPAHLDNFEDLQWLLASNELSHSVAQLRLDEAAWLYRKIRYKDVSNLVELGRFKGGTTFLMAAAGARVTSIDNEQAQHQKRYDEELKAALSKYHLEDRVSLVKEDAFKYICEPSSNDMVLVHFPLTEDGCWQILERWWPSLKHGGVIVFHPTPFLPDVVRFIERLFQASAELAKNSKRVGELVALEKHGELSF